MDTYKIVIIVLAALLVLSIAAVIVLKLKGRKKTAPSMAVSEVEIDDGVRYTKSDQTSSGTEAEITHLRGDVVLSVGKAHTAQKDGELLPGKYTVLSADKGTTAFNLRLGGFVREYSHGDDIVLGDGDEITAVSHTVILR